VIIAYLNTLGWFSLRLDCSDEVWFSTKVWSKTSSSGKFGFRLEEQSLASLYVLH